MLRAEAVHRHEDERRSCRRATLQWVVLVFFGEDQWGKLVDLSERGMCFQFEHPPALRQSINFTFEAMGCMAIPSEGHEGSVFGDSIQATGRVKWTREFERTAGVEFLELSPRSRDQIRYWISSGTSPEVASPTPELPKESNKKRSKKTDKKPAPFASPSLAAAPHALVEPAPSAAKALFEPRKEHFESDLADGGSDIEVVWEPGPAVALPALEETASSPRKWSEEAELEDSFTSPALEEPAAQGRKWPLDAEPESVFAPPDLELRQIWTSLRSRRGNGRPSPNPNPTPGIPSSRPLSMRLRLSNFEKNLMRFPTGKVLWSPSRRIPPCPRFWTSPRYVRGSGNRDPSPHLVPKSSARYLLSEGVSGNPSLPLAHSRSISKFRE